VQPADTRFSSATDIASSAATFDGDEVTLKDARGP
jgi:hypothetical protein